MSKHPLEVLFSYLPRFFPQVVSFLRRWWWALLLVAVGLMGLMLWIMLLLATIVIEQLPGLLSYLGSYAAPIAQTLHNQLGTAVAPAP